MPELILHHYPNSPFAEKVRLILGYKKLAWRSVLIPTILPKPDLVALTGGYRKTPVLQIGADIYCDTALIAQVLEQHQPLPTLYPANAPLAPLLAQWADSTLFWPSVTWALQPAGAAVMFDNPPPEVMKAFAADRAAMGTGARRQTLADGTVQLQGYLQLLDAQLAAQQAAGSGYLLGAAPCIADFSAAHPLWFIRRAAPVAHILAPYVALTAWLDRMLAIGHQIGHHQSTRLSSADALALAAASTQHAPVSVAPGLGFDAGQAVSVNATDYGQDPVAGTLVGLSASSVVLQRRDARAGLVQVHFPRVGFQIKKEVSA